MKKWIAFSILVFLFILFLSCQPRTDEEASESEKSLPAPVAQPFESMIDRAVVNFQAGDVSKGVTLLLDGILLVKPNESWPYGFGDIISSAKEHIQDGNMSDFGGSISKALSLIQPEFSDQDEDADDRATSLDQEPQEDDPAPVAQVFADMISKAKDEFKAGRADSGVLKILQALQLLTPHSK